ncbi:MAG TPA: hypothetical protein VJH03_04515 [Blastocatellia bacterium]|nr:hypothetical protein [Blastocatellia bacterium]
MTKSNEVSTGLFSLSIIVTLMVGSLWLRPSQAAGEVGKRIPVPGLTAAANNLAFAFERNRYVLVAPFAPSEPVGDESDLSVFDNHFIYIIDTKKPDAPPKRADLGNCYYPTRLVYDPGREVVFVRGTRYAETEEGGYEPIEVIAYIPLNLDDDGKPVFGNAISFPIKGRGNDEHCSDAPIDFVVGAKGKILVFTNGASIFTYSVGEGYIYRVDFGLDQYYGAENRIASINLDDATSTLMVSLIRRDPTGDGGIAYSHELKFYTLNGDGTVDLIKQVVSEPTTERSRLTPNSNVETSSDPDDPSSEFLALFISNDGSLCRVDLRYRDEDGDGVIDRNIDASVERIEKYPELARGNTEGSSPRHLSFDRPHKLLSAVKRGRVVNIKRPISSRPGGIKRPISVHLTESPSLVLAQLNGKKNKVVREKVFDLEFKDEVALSNVVFDPDNSVLLLSTYTGRLYSIDLLPGVDAATEALLGEIGSRVESLSSNAGGSTIVAISSYDTNEEGVDITQPGSVVVVRLQSLTTPLASLPAPSIWSAATSMLLPMTPSIKRPCGAKR